MRSEQRTGLPTPSQQVLLLELGFYPRVLPLGAHERASEEYEDEAEGGVSELQDAVRRFQRSAGLPETGVMDAATASALAHEDLRLHPRGDYPSSLDDERLA